MKMEQTVFRNVGVLILYADVSEHSDNLHRQRVMKNSSYLSAYEDGTNSVPKRRHIKFQTQGNYPEKKSVQHSEHGESLKSSLNI
jgi:hypothetical protein